MKDLGQQKTSFWESIADAERKKRAINKIEEILNILVRKDSFAERFSLMNGELGVILFLFYYSKTFNNNFYYDLALKKLDRLLELYNNDYNLSTYCNGLAGVSWCVSHISKYFLLDQDPEGLITDEVDSALFRAIEDCPDLRYTDFLHGALGIVYYFLYHDNPKTNSYLEYFVNRLQDLSIYDNETDGLKWESIDSVFSNKISINLGLAHGAASLIEILRIMKLKNISSEKTEKILYSAINFLKGQTLNSKNYISIFPSWVKENEESTSSRLGWCYGDLGIGLVLINTAIAFNHIELFNFSTQILEKTTLRRSTEQSMVIDAGLCHGSSGLLNMYIKLFNKTKNPIYKEAALYWFDKTLDLSNHKDGLAGYKSFAYDKFSNQYGLLLGVSGIGLSLLSFISSHELKWDSCLLIN